MTNVKKKGNIWENKLANWLRDNGIKAWKDGASGGGTREKGDIGNNIDFTIESKAAKNIKLMDWWRQVSKSASIHHNRPALFIHQDGMPDCEWIVCMSSEDWIDIVLESLKSANTESFTGNVEEVPRELKWKAERAKTAINEFIKELNKQ